MFPFFLFQPNYGMTIAAAAAAPPIVAVVVADVVAFYCCIVHVFFSLLGVFSVDHI